MAEKRIKRPRDPIALAKLIGDIATGQVADKVEDGRRPVAVTSGQQGGHARAVVLTSEQRKAIAKRAAAKRWAAPAARAKKEHQEH